MKKLEAEVIEIMDEETDENISAEAHQSIETSSKALRRLALEMRFMN